MRFFLFMFLILPLVLFGQNQGDIDLSFRTRINYGLNAETKKAVIMADGSVLLYAPAALFSGKKTGPLIKITSQGELDTTFNCPDFSLLWETFCCGPAFCENYSDLFLTPARDGSVFCMPHNRLDFADGLMERNLIRFKASGEADTAFNNKMRQLTFDMFCETIDHQIFIRLIGSPIKAVLLNWDGTLDTTFHHPFPEEIPLTILPNNKGEILGEFHTSTQKYYRRYDPALHRFTNSFGHQTFDTQSINWRNLIGHNRNGSIWENLYNLPDHPYKYWIQKRFSDGKLDTSFSSFETSYNITPNQIDSSGNLFIETGNPYESPSWLIHYDSTGIFQNSIKIKSQQFKLAFRDTSIEVGLNENRRWAFTRKGPNGQILMTKSTRYGLNGEVRQLIVTPSGKLIAVGDFTEYDSLPCRGLVRINPDGIVDETFQPQVYEQNDEVDPVHLSLKPNGDLILANSVKVGTGSKRFLYRILNDGTVDTIFGNKMIQDFGDTFSRVKGIQIDSSGRIWIIYCINSLDHLIRILADGQRDFTFSPFSVLAMTSNEGIGLVDFAKQGNDFLLFAVNTSISDPMGNHSGVQFGKLSLNNSVYEYQYLINAGGEINSPKSIRILSSGEKTIISINGYVIRHLSNLKRDSTFGIRIFKAPFIHNFGITGQTKQGDLILNRHTFLRRGEENFHKKNGILKVNQDGIQDTLFKELSIVGNPSMMAEPDSLHLYLAGSLIQYGNRPVNYLCRIHDKKSNVTLPIKNRLTKSKLILYPNPSEQEVRLLPTSETPRKLVFYSIQGKPQMEWNPVRQPVLSVQNWPLGIYYWLNPENGETGAFQKE